MPLDIIQMYANVTATADAVASIDIPEDGQITGVDWDIHSTGASGSFVDDDSMEVQLSFLATNQFATNDARGTVSTISMGMGTLTTSGNVGGMHGQKHVAFDPGIEVSGGERLHLHSKEGGTADCQVRCMIHLLVRTTKRRARRRR